MRAISSSAILCLGCAAAAPMSAVLHWPELQQMEAVFSIDWRSDQIDVDVPLIDVNGVTRYRLICRGGNEARLDKLADETKVNYVGPLMCVLNEGNREGELSLLRESKVAPWFTRGQFRVTELIDSCADVIDYGRVRRFLLRGFELTIENRDLRVSGGKLESSVLAVSVKAAPHATAAIAEQPETPNPRDSKGQCTQ